MVGSGYVYTPFEDLIKEFTSFLDNIFLQISEVNEKRKIKKSANLFVNLIINQSIKKDIEKEFTTDILKNMPEGIWNIETIALVEKNLKLIFDNDFMEKLKNNPNFKFEDPSKMNYFLKQIMLPALTSQMNGLSLLRSQISRSSIREKDKINVRLGRELIQTIDLMNEKTKVVVLEMDTRKDLFKKEFGDFVKRYWSVYTLLFLRIMDILLSYNKDKNSINKKMDYLGIERTRAKDYC